MALQGISAITFAVREMARSVAFYEACGLSVVLGGSAAEFTTMRQGQTFVNLIHTPGYEGRWWGRVIFRVDSADATYQRLRAAGMSPDPPRDAEWGERYFHLTDPDGHELSFAQLMDGRR